MKRIKIFSDFSNPTKAKEVYERLCEVVNIDYYGEDKEIYITDKDEYTHAVILNTHMPKLLENIPKENVIGLAFEPRHYLEMKQDFVDYAKKYISKYYVGDNAGLPTDIFIERFGYMWYNPPLKYIPVKNKRMSIMVSLKGDLIGHKYRHYLLKMIRTMNLPIDVYGNGCDLYSEDFPQKRGRFKETEPYLNYDFHIAIENTPSNDYFSEKIINPLLCGTTPLYLGCENIEKYFPDYVIKLSGNPMEDGVFIQEILKNPSQYKKNIDVEKVKETVSFIKNVNNLYS